MQNKINSVVSSTKVLGLSQKILTEWKSNPDLFLGFKTSANEFTAIVDEATQVVNAVSNKRANKKVEIERERKIRNEKIAAAKKDYEDKIQQQKNDLSTLVQSEAVAITKLARLAQGARHFAKSVALGDDNPENDAAGNRL